MKPPDWYLVWVEEHRRAFMLSAEWSQAAEVWYAIFDGRGVAGSELMNATRDIMTLGKDAPKYPSDHLPAVERSIGRARNIEATERRKSYGEVDTGIGCEQCSGGWVIVPHPRWVPNGKWIPAKYYPNGMPAWITATVSCDCPRGLATESSCRANGRPCYRLRDYERLCPDWRQEIHDKAEAEHRERIVGEQATAALGASGMKAIAAKLFSKVTN